MSRKTIPLPFPAAGILRRLGFDSTAQGPPSAPWGLNTRLEGSLANRLRGGSFTGEAASTVDDPRYVELVTENGDTIITENGDTIVLGPQYGVATGDDRVWVAPGDDAPTSGTADCLYRDRLFRVSSNIIMCSKQGDLTDWDYGGELEDTGRAMVLQLAEAGEAGVDVVALVPHKDAHLLCFSAGETWVLSGDPTTGTLRNVSREVGAIAARAWCKANDTVYFLSTRGLYSVGVDGSGLRPVSEDKVPEELCDITDADCVLDYLHEDRGVYIHLTTGPSWFYDTARDGFWPFDTTETDSHVLLGPFQLGRGDKYGRVLNLHGTIAAGSDDVVWRLVTGDTAEQAAANGKLAIEAAVAGADYSSYVTSAGTFVAGRSHMAYPRSRAIWCCLWLHSEGAWAWEAATMTATSGSDWR